MTDVLRATYSNLVTVKTRSTVQLVLELPIEAMKDVIDLLGPPSAGNEVWVAVARLRTSDAAPAPALIEEKPKRGSLAQQAGILCGEAAFIRYAHEHATGDEKFHGMSPEAAAEYVRFHCCVTSRSDLDKDEAAGDKFRELRASFKLWMSGIEA